LAAYLHMGTAAAACQQTAGPVPPPLPAPGLFPPLEGGAI